MGFEFFFTRDGQESIAVTSDPLELRINDGRLTAIVAGQVAEGRPENQYLYFGPLRFVLEGVNGPVIGFEVLDLDWFAPGMAPDATYGPRFTVPALGLEAACVGDIVDAARAWRSAGLLPIGLDGDTLFLGRDLAVTFQRTLRIPDDGNDYPLPPSLGTFPLRRVADYSGRVPDSWLDRGGVILPMYQREAMWMSFSGGWPPVALKVGVGEINAISGAPWSVALDALDQDYLVCPNQMWLDGINSGAGNVRQFVAAPLGTGHTVESQVTGRDSVAGIQLLAFGAHPDRLPPSPMSGPVFACASAPSLELGIAAGGQITQDIEPDPFGSETWDPARRGGVFIHIVDSLMWREITGEEPPPTPVTATTYAEHGLPWFSLYDESRGDLPGSKTLSRVRSVRDVDMARGRQAQQDDGSIPIPAAQMIELGRPPR